MKIVWLYLLYNKENELNLQYTEQANINERNDNSVSVLRSTTHSIRAMFFVLIYFLSLSIFTSVCVDPFPFFVSLLFIYIR